IRDTEMTEGMDRITGDYNEFWAGRDYLNQLDDMKTPMLMAHAFNDWNVMPEHSYRIYEAVKEKDVPSMIYYHQGGHGGPPPLELMNKWFTRYLWDIENGIEDEPRAWITREDDERTEPTPYPDYPHPEAQNVQFYLSPGAPEQGELTLERADETDTETLVDNFSFSGDVLAKAEWTDHRLIYVTPELEDSVHISGVPEITVSVASSKPAANLSVWLVSLPWDDSSEADITDNILTRGWADPQNHESISESEPLEPGEFYTFSFDLQPDDQVIPAGQQIGLMIFSSDREFTLRPDPGTELTIDLDKTSISLPIVGGSGSISFSSN
ncbi:MAG: CocE/NonD family hydrolase C-terminal non-catalytic domain-containing protein, partial [Balneolaceae bacterium]